jgi:hypothetical protein
MSNSWATVSWMVSTLAWASLWRAVKCSRAQRLADAVGEPVRVAAVGGAGEGHQVLAGSGG